MSNNHYDDHLELQRNRQACFSPAHVVTDGKGGITYRPLVRNPTLPCFGLPHRYWRGEFDQPARWRHSDGRETLTAHGCGGCGVKLACGEVAFERRDCSLELTNLHDQWESDTKRLSRRERYSHPTWTAFDLASRAHTWPDSHDEALAADKAKRADRERKRRKTTRSRRRGRRLVTQEVQDAIIAERNIRAAMLATLRTTTGAPPYVTKLPQESCERMADIWAARELLGRMSRERVTGKAIAEHLMRGGRPSINGLTSRVCEALKRIDRLENDGIWMPFEAPNSDNTNAPEMAAVWRVLEADDDADPVNGTAFITG